jgi:putative membrane protein
MKRFPRAIAVGVALGALGVGAAQAQTKTPAKAPTENKMNAAAKPACTFDDATKVRSVLQLIHSANQAEIKAAKLAQEKAKNPDVKAFADRMVKDHTDADKKLSDLAGKQNIDLNASMADPLFMAAKATTDAHARELGGKSGAAFDVAYIVGEPTEHLFVLKVIEEGQKVAKDDTKKALDDAHAMITKHKELAEKTVGMLQLPAGKGIGGGPSNQEVTKPGTTKEGSTKESTTKESPTKKEKAKDESPRNDRPIESPDNPDYQNPMQPKLP